MEWEQEQPREIGERGHRGQPNLERGRAEELRRDIEDARVWSEHGLPHDRVQDTHADPGHPIQRHAEARRARQADKPAPGNERRHYRTVFLA